MSLGSVKGPSAAGGESARVAAVTGSVGRSQERAIATTPASAMQRVRELRAAEERFE